MTHCDTVVTEALELAARGQNAAQIARVLRVPRRTVVDWISGRTPQSAPDWTPDAATTLASYPYLLGLYLGDGYIAPHPRSVFRLRIFLDAKYPGIISECAAAMRDAAPSNRVAVKARIHGDVEVSAYSKSWPHLFPQHGAGMKHLRLIVLAPWQRDAVAGSPQLLLRGLIHSDGCRFINTGRGNWSHPRYSFSNRSEDIRRIFCDACDLLGLRWTTAPHTVYVSRKADVAELDRFIGPKT